MQRGAEDHRLHTERAGCRVQRETDRVGQVDLARVDREVD
jgi:hypothetical protein